MLVLTLSFEPAQSGSNASWLGILIAHAAIVPRLAIAFTATLALLLSIRAAALRDWAGRSEPHAFGAWLAVHLAAFALLAQQTSRLFSLPADALPPALVAGWIILCAAVAITWALCLANAAAWREFARTHREALLLAGAGAVATWVLTLLAQEAWRPLADATLALARPLVAFFYPDVAYDAVHRTLATSRILLDIAPECSGYEGLALVTVFTGLYIGLFRDRVVLHRALWLFPIGWVAIWLANVVRIAAIVVIGTGFSPAIATQAFHSQAGWIAFALIGLAIVGLGHRSGLVLDAGRGRSAPSPAAPLLLPWMVLMGTSMVSAAFASDIEVFYPLPVVATALALWRFRGAYCGLFAPLRWEPIAIGVAVFTAWIALSGALAAPMPDTLRDWPLALTIAWIAFRIAGAVVVVPIVEELAFRGYLLRKLVDRDFESAAARRLTPFSLVASSLLFGIMHRSWIAATLAGAAFAFAQSRRGSTGDAILAHAVANGLIALAVLALGWWPLWG